MGKCHIVPNVVVSSIIIVFLVKTQAYSPPLQWWRWPAPQLVRMLCILCLQLNVVEAHYPWFIEPCCKKFGSCWQSSIVSTATWFVKWLSWNMKFVHLWLTKFLSLHGWLKWKKLGIPIPSKLFVESLSEVESASPSTMQWIGIACIIPCTIIAS